MTKRCSACGKVITEQDQKEPRYGLIKTWCDPEWWYANYFDWHEETIFIMMEYLQPGAGALMIFDKYMPRKETAYEQAGKGAVG